MTLEGNECERSAAVASHFVYQCGRVGSVLQRILCLYLRNTQIQPVTLILARAPHPRQTLHLPIRIGRLGA